MAENNLTTTKKDVAIAIKEKTYADSVLDAMNALEKQGQLVFPANYAVGNQLKLMYSVISQSPSLMSCTPASIGQALVEALIQGLEYEKKQLYFINMGGKLVMFRSYFGDMASAKNTRLVKEIKARVIYEDDAYDTDTNEYGELIIVNHKTNLANLDKNIVGAYAWSVNSDGTKNYCVMTWKEIQQAWNKSKNKGSVHNEFPQEMSKRTVIRRLVKTLFNSSLNSISKEAKAIIGSFNRTTENEYMEDSAVESNVQNKVVEEEISY